MRNEVEAANRRVLHRAVQVDPHEWIAGGRFYGAQYEFWSVTMLAEGGQIEERLAAVDTTERDVHGHRQWLEAFEAVRAALMVCPTIQYGEGRQARADVATLRVRCCPEWAEEERAAFDALAGDAARAALRVEVTTDGSEAPSVEYDGAGLYGELDGLDIHDGRSVRVDVSVEPLGPVTEVDEELRDYRRQDFAVLDDPGELQELAVELGRMVERWCPMPRAERVPSAWRECDVLVSAVDTSCDGLLAAAQRAGWDRAWWCRWCDAMPLGTFVVGDPGEGIACCEAHISDAVAAERREMRVA